jgi:hypothetical protein
MPIPTQNNVKLYETIDAIGVSEPYATEDAKELSCIISRCVSWAEMIASHPNVAARLGDAGAAHIQLATDLRTAMNVAHENGLYPNVVLPVSTYISAKVLSAISQTLEPGLAEMIEKESQRVAEDGPA